jgi:hypothetical protein
VATPSGTNDPETPLVCAEEAGLALCAHADRRIGARNTECIAVLRRRARTVSPKYRMATLTGEGYSFENGGPFYDLVRRLHLQRPNGSLRSSRIVAVVWLPMMVIAVVQLARGHSVDPLVRDISVHVRFLVALPLVLVSSHLLDAQCRGAVKVLYDAKLADPAALDAIMLRAEQLRTSSWCELVIALGSLALGQLGLWGVIGPTGLFHGLEQHTIWSFSRIWYGTIAFPLWQFVSARWMWRWAIWIYTLVRLARLPLAGLASHPDRATGLSCLAWPILGFCWYVAAFSSVLAGAWDTQVLENRFTVSSLTPTVATLIIVAIIVGFAPLLVFTPRLYDVRRRDMMKNTLFAFDYMRQFNQKWLDGTCPEPVLGSQDLQSLGAYESAFQIVASTRLTVFELSKMKNVAVAVLLPMLPLLATLIPLERVVPRFASALIPGL